MQQVLIAIASSLGATLVVILVMRLLSRRLRLVRLLAFPLYVAAVALGLRIFAYFELEKIASFEQALTWTLLFLGSVLAIRVAALYFFEVHLTAHRGVRLPPLLPTVAVIAGYLIAGLICLKAAFPKLEMAPVLATSAVTSLVLGLALQPILGNFFSGLVISLEQPFRINDWIKYGDVEAQVTDITWRTTHLRTRDNDNLVIPNSRIADEEILNFYYPHSLHLERVYVGVHYRTPPYRVKQALLDATSRVDGVLEKPSPAVFVVEFGESAIVYEVRVWIDDIADRPRLESHLRSEIWEEFRRLGITIPFPIRTLEIEPKVRTLEVLQKTWEQQEADAVSRPTGRLFVARGDDRGKSLLLGDGRAIVGRSSGCDMTLSQPKVSKEHFRVEWRDGHYLLTDLRSSFGTLVNGTPVEEKVLEDLDRISIGDTVILFESHGF